VAYQLPLPLKLKRHGWKVKIADKERLEEPHVTHPVEDQPMEVVAPRTQVYGRDT